MQISFVSLLIKDAYKKDKIVKNLLNVWKLLKILEQSARKFFDDH